MEYYQSHISDVLKQLSSSEDGLSTEEAEKRLAKYGRNQIRVRSQSFWQKLIEPFANVFMGVLFVAAVISFINHEAVDGWIIIFTMALNGIIYYAQQFSTERVLRTLQKYETQVVTTMRDGKHDILDVSWLVPGDIILLAEGEKVPADARIIHSNNARVDESSLTGESLPISKQTNPLKNKKELYEQDNMLFQGSYIVSGEATAVITSTGNHTEFGKLAQLSVNDNDVSPVQQKIDKLLSKLIVIISIITLVAFLLSVARGLDVAEAIRFVLTLAVSAVPESLPVAITVVLVLGMRRMAQQKALVRNMRAIESIGVVTTIATDKTGTLTKNKLTVQHAVLPSGNENVKELAHWSLLAASHGNGSNQHDPLDMAMTQFAGENHVPLGHDFSLDSTIPFEHQFAMSGNVWKHDDKFLLAAKGAPEHIISLCKLKPGQHKAIEPVVHSLTGQGFRVIALAHGQVNKSFGTFADVKKGDLTLSGFIAIADVLRPEAKPAVQAAQHAGVSVRIITGDHFETAFHIGKQLGMVTNQEEVFDGRETSELSPSEFAHEVKTSRVFSRVVPEVKHRILTVLKRKEVVAMTGDGVNDVPALTNAHIGIAMGSGSQIAKDAADIVVLDNNFRSIVTALREGRIIFSNIRRMLFYLLGTNAGEVLTMMGALLVGMPIPLATVQILWVNLVTDTCMVIPLGLEPGERDVMDKPPRKSTTPILDKFTMQRMVLIAATMALTTLIVYKIFLGKYGVDYARTVTFTVLVVMQWANAFNARSEFESIFTRVLTVNTKFYVGLVAAILLQAVALFGFLQEPLHVSPVAIDSLLWPSLIGIIVTIAVSELFKLYGRKTKKQTITI